MLLADERCKYYTRWLVIDVAWEIFDLIDLGV